MGQLFSGSLVRSDQIRVGGGPLRNSAVGSGAFGNSGGDEGGNAFGEVGAVEVGFVRGDG